MRFPLLLLLSLPAASGRAVSFDLGFIAREAKCSLQLIPSAKYYDDAKLTYRMHDGSFVSPAAHEGCCVLDKAMGMMELLYSVQKCKAYKAGAPPAADPRLRSPLLPQARVSPCYAGGLAELLREWPKCCHHHGRAVRPPGAQRLWQRVTHGSAKLTTCMDVTRQLDERARFGGLTAAFGACVAATNARAEEKQARARGWRGGAPVDDVAGREASVADLEVERERSGAPVECVRAAMTVVDIIAAALKGARRLYYGELQDPRDVTPSAHALLHLCDGVPNAGSAALRSIGAKLRDLMKKERQRRRQHDEAAAEAEGREPASGGASGEDGGGGGGNVALQVGCAARIERFLEHQLGRKGFTMDAGAVTADALSSPSPASPSSPSLPSSSPSAGSSSSVETGVELLKAKTCDIHLGVGCAFFDCPTATRALCAAPPPGHGGVVLTVGRRAFAGLAAEMVDLPSADPTVNGKGGIDLSGGVSFSLGLWLRTSAGGALVGRALPGAAASAWRPGATAFAVWTDGLLHFTGFSKNGCNGDFQEPHYSCTDARSNSRVDDGKWHHALVAYDAASAKVALYVDGRADGVVRRMPDLRRRAREAAAKGFVTKVGFVSARFPPPPHFDGTIADIVGWPQVALPPAAVWEEYERSLRSIY